MSGRIAGAAPARGGRAAAAAGGAASCIHRIDPRVRVVCLFGAALWVAAMPRLAPLLAVAEWALLLAVLARLPLGVLLRRVLLLDLAVLSAMLVLALVTGEADGQGLTRAISASLAVNALAVLSAALCATLSAQDLLRLLRSLHLPRVAVEALLGVVRCVDVFARAHAQMSRSAKARGFVVRADLHTVRTAVLLFASALAHSVGRMRRGELRAVRPAGPPLRLRATDAGFAALFFAVLLAIGRWL